MWQVAYVRPPGKDKTKDQGSRGAGKTKFTRIPCGFAGAVARSAALRAQLNARRCIFPKAQMYFRKNYFKYTIFKYINTENV